LLNTYVKTSIFDHAAPVESGENSQSHSVASCCESKMHHRTTGFLFSELIVGCNSFTANQLPAANHPQPTISIRYNG